MLRLIGFLVLFTATAGGSMYFDYKMSSRWSGRDEGEGLSFSEYLSGLSGRMAGLTGSAAANGVPTRLADMLPKPPEGWSVRPTEAGDADGFLPKSTRKADPAALAAVTEVASATGGSGTEVVALTYQKGDRKVLVKATRYPNMIFTSPASLPQRLELQQVTARFRGTEFATIRGLDVTEDLLPDGFRGRYFLAGVGGQIHLEVLAPKRMTDEDLLPFFQTLHVKAMNAGVIDKVPGLGDVPVIVLASALDGDGREAYLTDVARRKAEAAARIAAEQDSAAAAAQGAEAAPESTGFLASFFGGAEEPTAEATPADARTACATAKDGVKRCSVEPAPAAD